MYKYTEKFVADLLFNKNTIRIGTLKGFKEMESKKGISDPLEGSYVDTLHIDYFDDQDYFSNDILRDNVQQHIVIKGNCSGNVFINPTFITKRESPNFLIFCFAHTKSKEVINQFDGADTCFQIYKSSIFFKLVTRALEKELQSTINFLGIKEVSYGEYNRKRSGKNSTYLHPVLAKTEEFKPQCELRAVWQVVDSSIDKPFYDLTVQGLNKTCRLVEL